MTRTSPRGRRRVRRSSSTSRSSTTTNAVTPRWDTCPRRSTSNHARLNSVAAFRGELHFQLLPPPPSYIIPPASGLLKAKRHVADYLRSKANNFRPIETVKLIGGLTASSDLPESDLVWAVHDLRKRTFSEYIRRLTGHERPTSSAVKRE